MAVFPSGFALPPTPYLVAILGLGAIAIAALWTVRPPVNQAIVIALSPWMVTGGALYALFQTGELPEILAPFFSSPAVYVTTFGIAGLVWAVGTRYEFMAPVLVVSTGAVTVVGTVGAALGLAFTQGTLSPFWPFVAVVVAIVLTAGVWAAVRPQSVRFADTGYAGQLVVFGHAIDGVSTAVGADVLHFAEQTPLSRVVIEVGAALPTAELIGAGWLFVVLKVALAVVVVRLLGDLVRQEPPQAYALLGFVAAVGLGPGAHNVVLFAIAG